MKTLFFCGLTYIVFLSLTILFNGHTIDIPRLTEHEYKEGWVVLITPGNFHVYDKVITFNWRSAG